MLYGFFGVVVLVPLIRYAFCGTDPGPSIVKHITEFHGGTVSLESKPDKGTAISVCLKKEK